MVALIGESGSGKTTVSLSALGYCKSGLRFAGGEAKLNGVDLTGLKGNDLRKLRGSRVAYLPQSAAATFNPSMTINAQVTEAPVRHGKMSREEANSRALELYHALELPDPRRIGKRYPHQVSGGQLQRLMAAMALCGKPDLLVLDEPTTALDVTTQIEVIRSFKKVITDFGTSAVYVSHDLALVAQIADYVVVLYNGEVKEMGPTEVILERPHHPYTKRLIAAVRVGADLKNWDPTNSIADKLDCGQPILEIENMTAGYGGVVRGKPRHPVLTDINISLTKGKAIGIIGESGCGKSTLARSIAGLLPPTDGTILLNNVPLDGSYRARTRSQLRQIQLVYQMADTALNPKQKVSEIVGRSFSLYFGMNRRVRREKMHGILNSVNLPSRVSTRRPRDLSGGQKQRVNLARSLAANPQVILCDEVTSALDSIVAGNIVDLLKHLKHEVYCAFLFISHDELAPFSTGHLGLNQEA